MKQANLTLPPEKPCVVCQTLTMPWGRTRYGDYICSRKCQTEWDNLGWQGQFILHGERRP